MTEQALLKYLWVDLQRFPTEGDLEKVDLVREMPQCEKKEVAGVSSSPSSAPSDRPRNEGLPC